MTVDASEPFEKVRGYTYVEATMHGSVTRDDGSVGAYTVPLVLIYPDDGGNGVGVVDVPNSVFHWGTGFVPDPDGTLQLTRQTTDGFLFDEGYTYASVQWNKEVTDLFADDPADGSVSVAIITEATAGFLGAPRFDEEPGHWRQYELAGVAHTNPAITPALLSENHNPVVHVPVFRAAFANLARWASDGEPAPPSMHLAGEIDPETGGLMPEVGDDGNALGGLRLPHVAHEIDGRPAGAPLGTYTGLNPADLDAFLEPPSLDACARALTSIGGTFTPFGEDELRSRYPDNEAYVEQVRRAADHLLAGGYILEADRDAYVREAERHPLGQ